MDFSTSRNRVTPSLRQYYKASSCPHDLPSAR
ncbi:hypothetical protein FOMG_19823 [Fusarium oxysporum f. sp. melonis 26406]|uniref:Uncharacterized protein n=2 Tax=Fusarium oxysporum TaxID=5507 RepID=W9HAC8_FUSOX|nr:hypothetical protein FOYG_17601 [Fusarium oxysporum NRRL 32931]EXK23396.1 hypothetical protein FOMG_19823 [Fusarium oxysporum f. sp. melonis 26406]